MGDWAPCELDVYGVPDQVEAFLAALHSADYDAPEPPEWDRVCATGARTWAGLWRGPMTQADLIEIADAHQVRVYGWHDHAAIMHGDVEDSARVLLALDAALQRVEYLEARLAALEST